MRDFNTLWQPGYDHAGIAPQAVMSALAAEGKTPQDVGREEFVELCWDFIRDYGGQIMGQLRRSAPRSTTGATASRWTTATRAR